MLGFSKSNACCLTILRVSIGLISHDGWGFIAVLPAET